MLDNLLRYYSLEVVQHPLRARMCGFGDRVCHLSKTPRFGGHNVINDRIGDR